jgi:hypothetical protein
MRVLPVSVILTPGRGTFWSSVTTPRMAPVSFDWEKTAGAKRRMIAKKTKNFVLKYASFLA